MSFLPRTRGGALWRFALAAVLVVGFTAGTTAVAGLLKIKDIITDIDQTPAIVHARVQLPAPGAPETLLLIGSDHRAGTSYNSANTDTMMLVRIDDSSSTINLLSIPRDLAVELPDGGGTSEQKLNAAYSIGGPNLLIQTLQEQVFPDLQVNHILDLNFAGFSDLVDAIGCVYTMVDHRYYNNTALTDYSSIDIQPGYQKLCGDNQSISGALAFVRFRHTDSDVVRNARQQDFIRWAKDGYSVNQLLANEGKLLKIFGANVQTDRSLHTTDGLIDLFDLIVNADKFTLKTVQFPEYFGPCGGGSSTGTTGTTGTTAQTPCYVYPCPTTAGCNLGVDDPPEVGVATPAEEAAYQKLITPTATPTATTAAPTPIPAQPAAVKPAAGRPPAPAISTAGLLEDIGDGKTQAAALGHIAMPVYYPKYIQAGAEYCVSLSANCDDPQEPESEYTGSYPRKYLIHGYGNRPYAAYVFTVVINSALGLYYTVQGTTWQHPPILGHPSAVTVVGGRKLFEYADGGKLALVAYHTPQAVYWIANTLSNAIPNGQMIAMAASLTSAAS